MNIQSIVIALGESIFSPRIATRGFELAVFFNATVKLLLVRNNTAILNASLANTSIENDDTMERQMGKIKQITEKYSLVEHSTTILNGDPQEQIIQFMTNNLADLLIVGTHGRTGLDHLISGSTAEYIIRHSTIPVLVLPYNHETH